MNIFKHPQFEEPKEYVIQDLTITSIKLKQIKEYPKNRDSHESNDNSFSFTNNPLTTIHTSFYRKKRGNETRSGSTHYSVG